MIVEHHHIIAFVLTLIAGLATIIGGAFFFFFLKNKLKKLALGVGFFAGGVVYMGFVESF